MPYCVAGALADPTVRSVKRVGPPLRIMIGTY
jgi:hypothetical protein